MHAIHEMKSAMRQDYSTEDIFNLYATIAEVEHQLESFRSKQRDTFNGALQGHKNAGILTTLRSQAVNLNERFAEVLGFQSAGEMAESFWPRETGRHAHERDLERQRVGEGAALSNLSTIVTRTPGDFKEFARQTAEVVARLLDVPEVVVRLYSDDDGGRTMAMVLDGRQQDVREGDHSCAQCDRLLREQDVYRRVDEQPIAITCPLLARAEPIHSILVVPARQNDAIRGSICITDRKMRDFDSQQVYAVRILASYLAFVFAQKQLEEQLRASEHMTVLGRVAAGVAYDVRNPLTAMLGLVEALFDQLPREHSFGEYERGIRAQIWRLNKVMKNLESLGRPLETGALHTFEAGALVQNTLEAWREVRAGATPVVEVSFGPLAEKALISGDQKKLEQAALNILENATVHGNSPIDIKIRKIGAMLIVKVADSGPGLTSVSARQCFEPFFSTRQGGTGLGLTVARNVIESHGGSISMVPHGEFGGVMVEFSIPVSAPRR
jgi:signal transduction histidine kinase